MGEFPQLTARQWEIVKLISVGRDIHQIAKKLGLSENTISRHKDRIYKKLRVNNALELVLQIFYIEKRGRDANNAIPSRAEGVRSGVEGKGNKADRR